MENYTPKEKQKQIQYLQEQKRKLLDKYGLFGGGQHVNELHKIINRKLEQLGVDPNS